MKEPKLIQVLNLVTDEKNFTNPQRGRVYSPSGIAPALNTCGGGRSRTEDYCSDCQGRGTMQGGLSISTSVTSPIRFTRK
nr:MAG TPA_asm: hypothetical protein [Caudoviricetes sp.]